MGQRGLRYKSGYDRGFVARLGVPSNTAAVQRFQKPVEGGHERKPLEEVRSENT